MSLFQSNLRKQIRNLPKTLNFVKIIHYYSKLFTGVLSRARARSSATPAGASPSGSENGRSLGVGSDGCADLNQLAGFRRPLFEIDVNVQRGSGGFAVLLGVGHVMIVVSDLFRQKEKLS